MLEILIDRLEVLWVTTNPKLGKELLDIKDKGKIKTGANGEKEIDGITPGNFIEKWEEMKKNLPKELRLPEVEKRRKYVFSTFSRNRLRNKALGLHIDSE